MRHAIAKVLLSKERAGDGEVAMKAAFHVPDAAEIYLPGRPAAEGPTPVQSEANLP